MFINFRFLPPLPPIFTMPQIRNTRSKIPVAGQKPPSFPSKKSDHENLKLEVKNKQKPRGKISKSVPAVPDGEKR